MLGESRHIMTFPSLVDRLLRNILNLSMKKAGSQKGFEYVFADEIY